MSQASAAVDDHPLQLVDQVLGADRSARPRSRRRAQRGAHHRRGDVGRGTERGQEPGAVGAELGQHRLGRDVGVGAAEHRGVDVDVDEAVAGG
jgi:hypothetical protein